MVNLMMAGWAFVVSPVLCLAGVMTHECDPHSAASTTGSACCDEMSCYCADEPQSTPCPHEGGCATDPCQQIVVVRDGSAQRLQIPVLQAAPHFVSPAAAACCAHPHVTLVRPRDRTSDLPTSLHPSDLPLLI